MEKIYLHTFALCNECKTKAKARIISKDNKILLEKFCIEHGLTYTLLSNDVKWFENSMSYVKPREYALINNVEDFSGCPESCGLCPEHQQHTCLPVIEITNECNMACPVCLKDFDNLDELNLEEFENILTTLENSEKNTDVVNISGGEPTIHPMFRDFITLAQRRKFTQISVSTNGIKLLNDKSLREYFTETGIIAALQFDGFSPKTYLQLRGHDYSAQKLELIDIFEKEDINYSLVATVAKGINDHEITTIADFFFNSKSLSLMYQPMAFTGKAKSFDLNFNRLTIADVVKEIEKSDFVNEGDFNPLPCSHYSCFALSYYVNSGEGKYYSLKEFVGRENYLDIIANKTLPGLDSDGLNIMKEQIYRLWSAADSSNLNDHVLKRIKQVITELNSCGCDRKKSLEVGMKNMKAIFIHHFMDEYNFDFGRLVKCCNPYPKKNGKLIPICAQNVFNEQNFG